MCPERILNARITARQSGFGLPMAVFVITVLALVIAAMAQLQQSSSEGSSLQLQSQRAFYAAESGLQLSLNLLLPPDGSAGRSCASVPLYAHDFSSTNSLYGLSNCSVRVECQPVTVDSEVYFTLTSTGTCGSGTDSAQRTTEVRVK
mgnify:FL=1